MTQTPELSVILPALNVGNMVRGTVERILRAIPGIEIIIVDDHSTDNTRDAVEALKREHPGCVKVLHHRERRGKGTAIRDAMPLASGRFIAYLDADGVIDPTHVQQALSYLRENPALDLVFGQRKKYATTLKRKCMSLLYRCVTSVLFLFPFWDTQAGLKMFRADIARRLFGSLTSRGYAFDVELLARARSARMNILPFDVQQEGNGRSNVSFARILETIQETFRVFVAVHSPTRASQQVSIGG